jgi:hypothetical protein
MTYVSGSLHRDRQTPQRARNNSRASSHPCADGPIVRGAGVFVRSNALSSSHMPLRHSLPLRPMSATRATSSRKNASRGSKGCTAPTPYCLPPGDITDVIEAEARRNGAFTNQRDIRSHVPLRQPRDVRTNPPSTSQLGH